MRVITSTLPNRKKMTWFFEGHTPQAKSQVSLLLLVLGVQVLAATRFPLEGQLLQFVIA